MRDRRHDAAGSLAHEKRPRLALCTGELAALVLEHSDDPKKMRYVWQELGRRRRCGPRELREFVNALVERHAEGPARPGTDAPQADPCHILDLPVVREEVGSF